MNKWLVTSGCSFSDNIDKRWPHFLADSLKLNLVNYGYGSSGNDYICHSTIFAVNNLLNNNIDSKDITVVVMWSGIDRQGHFVSKKETYDFDKLINPTHINPLNFLYMSETPSNTGKFVPTNKIIDSGWLLGSPNCCWENEYIRKYKRLYFDNFYTYEGCVINSLNYFLQLQWFCESKNIKLVNLCFKEILHGTYQYPTAMHLYHLIDFAKWIFWDKDKGLYEYTRDNKLSFYDDNFHPSVDSHKHFVDNFLINNI